MIKKILGKILGRFHSRHPDIYKVLDIGEGTRVSWANLDGMFPQLVRIGKNCVFAPTAMVLTHDASYYVFNRECRVAAVSIGDNVFIGYGVIVMPGINIGNNVVIAAGAIVTKDIPDNTVVAGVPAKILCSIDEYLSRRNVGQIFQPCYSGKTPRDVNKKDVAEFREQLKRINYSNG